MTWYCHDNPLYYAEMKLRAARENNVIEKIRRRPKAAASATCSRSSKQRNYASDTALRQSIHLEIDIFLIGGRLKTYPALAKFFYPDDRRCKSTTF